MRRVMKKARVRISMSSHDTDVDVSIPASGLYYHRLHRTSASLSGYEIGKKGFARLLLLCYRALRISVLTDL